MSFNIIFLNKINQFVKALSYLILVVAINSNYINLIWWVSHLKRLFVYIRWNKEKGKLDFKKFIEYRRFTK